jgi:hypothetical protein
MKTREKIIAGIRLDVPDESGSHAAKGGHGEGEGLWIFSFCDLIMNLLMFFVMMFAISSVDQGKLAQIQHALVSYSTKPDEKKELEAKPAPSAAAASIERLSATSPEDAMKRIKELLESIDVSKLKSRAALTDDFEALKNRIVDLEKLVGAQVAPDQDDSSFQIVLAPGRVLDSTGQVTPAGALVLEKLVRELERFENPLRLSILHNQGGADSALSPEREAIAWRESAQAAAAVATGLRVAGLPTSHLLSAGGLGFLSDSETVPQWPGSILIHVSLLREKPYVHRGKDGVK